MFFNHMGKKFLGDADNMTSSGAWTGLRLFGGIIRAAFGLFFILFATLFLFIFRNGPFSWLMVTVVVLLYVKGIVALLFAHGYLRNNSSTQWNKLLSPLGWKLSGIGFAAVALLFALSAVEGEESWLIAGALVYGGFTVLCLFAASRASSTQRVAS
jgi:hypothetical protein